MVRSGKFKRYKYVAVVTNLSFENIYFCWVVTMYYD